MGADKPYERWRAASAAGDEFEVTVHLNTVKNALKQLGFVWKRTRYSLKNRDAQAFARSTEELEQLIGKAHEGEIEVAYVDEGGFSLAPPVRSAWTLRGKTHKAQPQKTGRLNVMGAMFSSGGLYFSGTCGQMTSLAFAGFLSQLLKRTAKPLVVVVDNASIHAAKAVRALLQLSEFERLTLTTPFRQNCEAVQFGVKK